MQIVDLEDVSVSFRDRKILKDVTWWIAPGERTGVLGANGVGESTLRGSICRTLEPSEGVIERGTTLTIVRLSRYRRHPAARPTERTAGSPDRMAVHDRGDHDGCSRLHGELRAAALGRATLEERWFELSERVG